MNYIIAIQFKFNQYSTILRSSLSFPNSLLSHCNTALWIHCKPSKYGHISLELQISHSPWAGLVQVNVNQHMELCSYLSYYLIISRIVVELNLWTYGRSMKTLSGCKFHYFLFGIQAFIKRKNAINKIKIALHDY